MTDSERAETVSVEAHERVKAERDEAKARTAELEATVADLGRKELATDYFRSKGIADPTHWAGVALPHIREVAPDDLGAKLETLFPNLPAAAPPVESETQPPAPKVGEDVGFGVNPAAPSVEPGKGEMLKVTDKEFRDLVSSMGAEAATKKLIAEGRFAFSDENLKAQATAH